VEYLGTAPWQDSSGSDCPMQISVHVHLLSATHRIRTGGMCIGFDRPTDDVQTTLGVRIRVRFTTFRGGMAGRSVSRRVARYGDLSPGTSKNNSLRLRGACRTELLGPDMDGWNRPNARLNLSRRQRPCNRRKGLWNGCANGRGWRRGPTQRTPCGRRRRTGGLSGVLRAAQRVTAARGSDHHPRLH
jgi:hypothetical protein